MAKRVDSVGGDLDRIGTLPDPILSHILSFLPSKEAIRTSVLSSRWRYMFATMPTFDFTDCLRSLAIENGNNFKNFVDRLLSFQNQASLECFMLQKFSWIDDSHLYGWISAVLSRGVKKLVLYTDTPVSPAFSSRMFTSHSLVELKLETYGVINVPNDVCLPNLKILRLIRFILVDDSIFRLISSCIVLEELVLTPEEVLLSDIIIQNPSLKILQLKFVKGGRGPNNLVEINAPNLVNFRYSGDVAERYTLSNMKSLRYACIRVDSSGNGGHVPTYLVQAICNVQFLFLSFDLPPVLPRTSREPVLAFNNLVRLCLLYASCEWLLEFLHCVPILKTLSLLLDVADWGLKELPEEIPSCLSFHLKEIQVASVNRDRHIELIKYFLDNAMVLEKLRIGINGESLEHQSGILEKLTKLPKKSKKCQVIMD